MIEFSVNPLPQTAIQYLYALRDSIWLDPPYQRMSDIWTKDKRQLLIDSVINGFDIPKLYFHELVPPKKDGSNTLRYAIIDGKQRLESLWSFMDGAFALSDDFQYLLDDGVDLAGLTYREIGAKYPLLKSRFDSTSLSVVGVRTNDTELIEEMFSRLNEAAPLNAPEKRNAFGGPLPPVIRDLSVHRFFRDRLPFSDRRYRHRDLATKFLYIENSDTVVDTKKAYLDAFVRDWATENRMDLEAMRVKDNVEAHLERMSDVFTVQDHLLKSIGMTILTFHFFRLVAKLDRVESIQRQHFEMFDRARSDNRSLAQQDIAKADYDLLEFDKYVQTPNDSYATRIRLSIMVKFMRESAGVELPETHDDYFARKFSTN